MIVPDSILKDLAAFYVSKIKSRHLLDVASEMASISTTAFIKQELQKLLKDSSDSSVHEYAFDALHQVVAQSLGNPERFDPAVIHFACVQTILRIVRGRDASCRDLERAPLALASVVDVSDHNIARLTIRLFQCVRNHKVPEFRVIFKAAYSICSIRMLSDELPALYQDAVHDLDKIRKSGMHSLSNDSDIRKPWLAAIKAAKENASQSVLKTMDSWSEIFKGLNP